MRLSKLEMNQNLSVEKTKEIIYS